MNLKKYDGKTVRLTTRDGEIFDGECGFSSAEYCLHEYGREEDALEIDSFLFFKSQIQKIEEITDGEPRLWFGRPLHRMKLDHDAFVKVENGSKTVEMRLNDEKRRRIAVGDVIRFEDGSDEGEIIHVEVVGKRVFRSFGELYASLPLGSLGYGDEELSAASPDDMLKYYTEEEQIKNGVVGIEIRLL